MLLTPFDPWKSELCTCPAKLTLNPYTGCSYGCLYCYASSYIPHFHHARPKRNLIRRLEKEARKLKGEFVSIANSSDPYPLMERNFGLTRKCLQTLSRHDCRVQLVTKSPLVTRDAEILEKIPSMVSMTITTEDDNLARLLEPFAPSSTQRFKAINRLLQNGIPVSVRIDPLIPFINDDPERLIGKLASMGVLHVTCSTYKAKHDNWKRVAQAFPKLAKSLSTLYFDDGERKGRTVYLSRSLRGEILEKAKNSAEEAGMKFGCCREGFPRLNSATCDGSWLIPDH